MTETWKPVVLSAYVEEDGECPGCRDAYEACDCPGPTMDDEYEYKEMNGQLFGKKRTSVFKSLYFNQDEILESIRELHSPNGFDVDCTYGNGTFWKTQEKPRRCFDIEPLFDFVERADSTNLPLETSSIESLVFDPPFLTYIREQRAGNGKMIMAKRFAGYWRSDELESHYKKTITEARRVLKENGRFVVKCQDIVHNHALYLTHKKVIDWAEEAGFKILDLFILGANHRLPAPNRKGKQKHARVFHSYFLVFKAKKKPCT